MPGRKASSKVLPSCCFAPRISQLRSTWPSTRSRIPAADVQKTVLDVIDKLMADAGEQQARHLKSSAQRLADARELLAPSLRKRLPSGGAVIAFVEAPVTAKPIDPFDPQYALQPVATVGDALELVAYALEHPHEADTHESALDAIARHADVSRKLAGPLRKRARALARRHGEGTLSTVLAHAVLAWCGVAEWPDLEGEDALFRLAIGRARAVSRHGLPLLSTPTHRAGWLEPAHFRSVLSQYTKASIAPDKHDAVMALMRLPKNKRKAAATSLGKAVKLGKRSLNDAITPPKASFLFHIGPAGGSAWQRLKVRVKPRQAKAKGVLEPRRALLQLGKEGDEPLLLHDSLTVWRATVTPDDLSAYFAHGAVHLGGYVFDEATGMRLIWRRRAIRHAPSLRKRTGSY